MTAAQAIVSDLKARGFVLHPLSKPDDKGNSPGKRPLMKGWQTFSKTPDDIEKYIEEGYNIGLVCGKASGIDAIDIDNDIFQDELLDGVEFETLTSGHRSGRGHLLFQHRDDIFSEKHHFIGIEYFGNNKDGVGSNLVIPPSIHYSGEPYKWNNPDIPLAKIPDRLKENWLALCKKEDALHEYFKKCRYCFTKGSKKYDKNDVRSKGIWERPDSIAVHGMDGRQAILSIMGELKTQGCPDELLHMACKRFFGKDYKFDETEDALKYIKPIPPKCETLRQYLNVECDGCRWKPKEYQQDIIHQESRIINGIEYRVGDTIEDIQQKTAFHDRPDLMPLPIIDDARFTDTGNAKLLVAMFGDRIRYCHPWKSWLCWNGKIWERDNSGQVYLYTKMVAETEFADANNELKKDPSSELEKKRKRHALASMSATKRKAMLVLAESEPGVSILPEDLDKNKMLFNVQNGTYDFDKREFREHRREDYITKISPVVYDLEAKRDLWEKFLDTIMAGNKNIIGYLKRKAGYIMTGLTREEEVDILYGVGGNGKSKYTGQLIHNMGDYAVKTNIETIQATKNRNGSAPSPDVIDLKGARLVTCSEPEMNTRLNESRIKDWTGRDPVKARGLNEKPIQFMPEFKLLIYTNYPLSVMGTDKGIKRRLKQIPFEVVIPEGEKDLDLDKKLLAESSGILNWMIEGCLEYLTKGLQVPEEIIKATADYMDEQDIYGEFINVCCLRVPKNEEDKWGIAPFKKLYEAFKLWCEVEDKYPLKDKQFGTWLTNHGFQKKDVNDEHLRKYAGRRGIRLVPDIGDAVDLMTFSSEVKDGDGENFYAKNRRAAKDIIRHIANKQMPKDNYSEDAKKILEAEFGAREKPSSGDMPRAKRVWAERLRYVLLEQDRDITDDEAMRFVEDEWKARQWI